ncbi:hypothetical protein ABT095_02910 [Kitasatospora sp. NPDC002227]|uniref:hypothetical protein n=1 Tax=Kitasatospora sp. NPDC002227 TaxID=3154773 RepID=UPI00331F0E7E
MAYRYWCGECGFKTGWGTAAQGEQQQIEHYRKQHPGLVPGGQVEVNRLRPGGSRCCLPLLAALVLLLALAAACRH